MMSDNDSSSGPATGTDRLIEMLSKDARGRRRFEKILLRAVTFAVGIAAIVFFVLVQPRPDLELAARTARVLFKFIITVPLAIAMIGLLDRIGRPAAPLGPWPWLLGGIGAMLAVGVGAELALLPPEEWATSLIGTNARYCMLFIPLIAIGPLFCFIVALRQGMPTHPGLAGAAAGIASGAIAAAFYASHCPDDSPLFVATWYTLATCIVAACGYAAGRRFL
ncbi:NrsF family protein [Aurantimonas endophytica]|uniref:DUF1109 family protein n=2 Tax=Aurantimonas endophytica TaxID=1522175 RepID=A0A7W6HI45_9HYPH|nr:NrsF family protein [Aurantimonas endophytica]MBB4005617.1 hypothetical protein [Aurantimonas endophytica]